MDSLTLLTTRSSAVFDIDDDGDLDVLTNDFNSEPMVLINDLSSRKEDISFLKVRLEGRKSNRDALGAIVKVHAGSDVFTKVNDGQSGYLSQSKFPLYFGLGHHKSIDRIEIQWPSGASQTVASPTEINRTIDVVESEGN